MQPTTKTIHAAAPESDVRPLVTPIYETTTFVFENAEALKAYNEGRSTQYLYSRYGNPTVVAVERTLAALDGAEAGLLFSSGMAATASILMGLLSAGDEVICAAAIYGGTLHLLGDVLSRFGITTRFVSTEDLHHIDAVIGPQTKVVWFESPVNPTLRIVDVAKVAGDVRADLLVGHVRSATVGGLRTENTHPFRYRQWLFAQTGTLPSFDAIRDRLAFGTS